MKPLLYKALSILALLSLTNSVLAEQFICGIPQSTRLMAGQSIDSGTVTISNDQLGNITLTFNTVEPWILSDTHAHVAKSLDAIPQTRSGNPKVGNFSYKTTHTPGVSSYSYTIAADEIGYNLGDTIYIATHAVVQRLDTGEITQQETAWGEGNAFPGRNWAMYFTYILQACDDEPNQQIQPGDFRTQTQGGWGTICRGNNPGCYRDSHYATAFPSGVLIGDTSGLDTDNNRFAARFISSLAVQDFLPQGGTPAPLSMDHEDPAVTEAGVLAGQITALTLSIYFDYNDISFGASSMNLADLIVVNGSGTQCDGMSVWQILDTGNQVLSGDGSSVFSPSAINACISSINENFVDGTMVGTYLRLP